MSKEELQRLIEEAVNEGDESKEAFFRAQLANLEQNEAETEAVIAEAIQLPQDYDEKTGLPGMNAEIRHLIQQAIEAVTNLKDAQIAGIHTEYRERLQETEANAADADKSRIDAEALCDVKDKLLDEKDRIINQLTLERDDAFSKRDAAVQLAEGSEADRDKYKRMTESYKTQVDELERLLEQSKRPAPAPLSGLTFTSTLPVESAEEKAARLKRLEQERINRNLERYNIAPLKIPGEPKPEPKVTEEELDQAFQGVAAGQEVVRDQSAGEGVQAAEEAVGPAGDAETGALTLESLDVRIKALEEWSERANNALSRIH